MAFTEKVALSGTAQSFLLYECVNSSIGQEGFLIGDVTSEVTNHISDSFNDSARLDIQIIIRTILPLPSVSHFYFPTGKIRDDMLSEFLSHSASGVVGWYKYRRNASIKPTFRDKLISKGLQKYFEKNHARKNFVTCILSSKTSICNSTHTFTYRFGKINCFNMYEYVEDVTGNLGEKVTGYKKTHKRLSSNGIFNKVVKESNVENENDTNAILKIQEAVDLRLKHEARTAMVSDTKIRELEAEIKQMTAILSDRHKIELEKAYEKLLEEKKINDKVELAQACVKVLTEPMDSVTPNHSNYIMLENHASNDVAVRPTKIISRQRARSPILSIASGSSTLNYAAALKKKTNVSSTTNTDTNNKYEEDLISFDVEVRKVVPKSIVINEDPGILDDSSTEY